jgi:hypothetical protein
MASIKISGDTSGEITISAPAVAGTNTLTLPANTGNILTSSSDVSDLPTAPSFSARISSAQSVSANTFTKMQTATEDWDTDSKFDNSSNYRFTPTVAGYYMFSMSMRSNSTTTNGIALYKNGSVFKRKFVEGTKYVAFSVMVVSDADDYFEVFGYTSGTEFDANADDNYFQAHFVRSA